MIRWIGLGLCEAGGMRGSDIWVIGPKEDISPFILNQVN